MKNLQKIATLVSVVLSLGILFIRPAFTETSVTFSASCYIPSFVTVSEEKPEAIIETQESQNSYVSEDNPNLIEQQEEIISEDESQVELMKTVCAK